MIDTIARARDLFSKVSKKCRRTIVVSRTERKNMKESGTHRAPCCCKGNPYFFFGRDLNLNGRTAPRDRSVSFVCAQGIPYGEHKGGEWFISRGERAREICISTYRLETSAVLKSPRTNRTTESVVLRARTRPWIRRVRYVCADRIPRARVLTHPP